MARSSGGEEVIIYISREVIFNKNTPNVVDGHNNSSIDNARELYGAL
jgi:hypothetical protein